MPVFASLLAASGALRVASLNLCTDEYLLLLAHPGEIASVSRLSHDPADSPLWRKGRRALANLGTLESALPSRPTLLLTMGGGGKASAMIAERLRMKTLDLPFPANLEDVEANMTRVAAALGDPGRAASWRRKLRRLRATLPRPRDAIYLSAGGISVGANSLGAQWMLLAGFAQRPLPGGRATLETLTLHPPAILLRANYRRAQPSLGQRWLAHPLAHHAARTVDTDGRAWTCAGPSLVEEITRLRGVG
ncbi:MAG: ABC transporter substrate-binding protein [Sphingomonas sp.]|uniref:hypothetical protein n=1 Tax=Sphingomonas sp. TaxID=28214 RepID=UPI00183315E7|nr:hypothetical protein [Sphingomonas sp.]MBA3667677.1 ABC transporter substrate-binding protein [Sphingomonas sp.]